MNKTAIKSFAVWARNKLIADISYKAGLMGVSEDGIKAALPQSTKDMEFYDIGTKEPYVISGEAVRQRKRLADLINQRAGMSDYKTAYRAVIEEVAYTWFNRLIAIRLMEVNDYLPSRIRVLSSESGNKLEPDLVTTPFDADLELSDYEKSEIVRMKNENQVDECFRMLFVKQCNALNEVLPMLFENTADYSELLLNVSFTDKDGVVYHLTHDISEGDFNVSKEGQVEIIGWMYQYYISEKHEEVIDPLHGKTIKKEDIPAATQLFTTDWVVRYMVDNSLGRYWIERNPDSKLAEKLDFFITPKNGEIHYINEKVQPQDLTFFDPCMGSGHILVYAFDVLMEIYRECGYSDRDAALNIVQFNLFGMDIDKRAYQLAYFAVMMKARSYNRRALTQGEFNNLAVIEESNSLSKFAYEGMTNNKEQNKIGEYLIDVFRHAKEIGSLQTIEKSDYKAFAEYLLNIQNNTDQIDIFSSSWSITTLPLMLQLTKQAYILSGNYAVVCTNPPYMNKLESHLKDFVITNYKAYSGDLFSVFMYRNFDFCKKDGYSAFMTPNVWMFIKSYEALRNYILDNKSIASLVQMAKGAFFKEATVDICTFVLRNQKSNEKGLYFRLENFKGDMEVQKQKVLEAQANKNCGYFYESAQDNFSKIPGSPIAYWVSNTVFDIFSNNKSVDETFETRNGMSTTNNNLFLRLWFECSLANTGFYGYTAESAKESRLKWFPYNKGGEYRRWYGNNHYLVNWKNDGEYLKSYVAKRYGSYSKELRSENRYFYPSVTWSGITTGRIGFRLSPQGAIFDSGANGLFTNSKEELLYVLSLLNTHLVTDFVSIINPTINTGSGTIGQMPVVYDEKLVAQIYTKANECVLLSRIDWDSFETSWDFRRHPLVELKESAGYGTDMSKWNHMVEGAYHNWESLCEQHFNTLKSNEEELNRIFIDIYGLQDELAPEVEDKDVTVRKADLQRDIKSLLSYTVGCMFGRYSLDVPGLAYAGGDWDDSKYTSFIPNKDNILPITDEEYFEDDIIGLFCGWLKKVYGADTLEENLDFIAKALNNKGNTSREVIRNYFLNDFMKDHMKTYQKRPIYWLFDSGKQNGFKALIYMHRYDENTIGNLRIDYLHRMERVYESEIVRMQDIIDNSRDGREVTKATKRKEKLQKQVKECKEYDEKIAHLALARIPIDLDDGVKVNYEKVQTVDGKKYPVLAKI